MPMTAANRVGLAVFQAAKAGDVEQARHLILDHVARRGSVRTFYAPDDNGTCAFELWADTGSRELLDVLEPLGIEWSPFSAVAWGNTEALQRLCLDDPGVLVREHGIGNPMHWALYHGRLGLARWLLARGIDVPATEGRLGYVRAAVLGRHEQAIRFAAAMGAAIDHGDVTALHAECRNGWARFVPLLLELGADPDRPDAGGNTALHLAAKRGTSRALVKLLVEHGADPERRNARGLTPLDLARRAKRTCARDYLATLAG